MNEKNLQNEYEISVQSAVRSAIAAGRFDEKIAEVKNCSPGMVRGSFFFMGGYDKGIAGGHGQVFRNFLASNQLFGYNVECTTFSDISDPNYNDAKLQIVHFDQTFKHLPYDVVNRKCTNFCEILIFDKISCQNVNYSKYQRG